MSTTVPLIMPRLMTGLSIEMAFRRALDLAWEKNRPVIFRFNGTKWKVTKRLPLSHLLRQWRHRTDAMSLVYWRSPEGIAQKARDKAEVARRQRVMDRLETEILGYTADTGLKTVVGAIQLVTEEGDHIGLRWNPRSAGEHLQSLGFTTDYGIGQPPAFFEKSEHIGRYVIGQAMSFLLKGSSPHPVTQRFCNDYFKALAREEQTARLAGKHYGEAPPLPGEAANVTALQAPEQDG